MENDLDNLSGFQWDRDNIDKNLLKHKVKKWECEQVFFNKPILGLQDPSHSGSDKRWAALGKTDAERLLVVVFTKRGNLLRVICARDMNKKEREFYEENE